MKTAGARRKEAADVARRLLQDKVDQVANLAESGTKVDAAEAAVETANAALAQARAEYAEHYRLAITAGWTDDQLTEAGCSAERGGAPVTRSRTRRRRAVSEPASTSEREADPSEVGRNDAMEPVAG
jgi:hypothetical protein